ncbi:MAG: protein-glutamine gamma-glutamyltransferase [Oscillospiraceae bacterium]|jgi:protein-glutamine gamma-glutamyltransferase|nr:protein-glutamine gamma-glutamyltransferase [Oscillospiraceae bacterium]
MITINGNAAPVNEIAARYTSGGIESSCVRALAQSGARYDYPSVNVLDFELAMRREIVNSAARLLRSGLRFEVFRDSYCNMRYWVRTMDGGFDLRPGAQPSAAVRDIYQNGTAYGTECATAMQIVYFGALIAVVGDAAFDRAFSGISLMNWHKLTRALAETGSMRQFPDYLAGDRRYFANPDVNLLTPEWQGENVIDMGDGSYYGHGVGRLSGGEIIANLNQNRRPASQRGAYLMQSAGRPDFVKLYQMFGR